MFQTCLDLTTTMGIWEKWGREVPGGRPPMGEMGPSHMGSIWGGPRIMNSGMGMGGLWPIGALTPFENSSGHWHGTDDGTLECPDT